MNAFHGQRNVIPGIFLIPSGEGPQIAKSTVAAQKRTEESQMGTKTLYAKKGLSLKYGSNRQYIALQSENLALLLGHFGDSARIRGPISSDWSSIFFRTKRLFLGSTDVSRIVEIAPMRQYDRRLHSPRAIDPSANKSPYSPQKRMAIFRSFAHAQLLDSPPPPPANAKFSCL